MKSLIAFTSLLAVIAFGAACGGDDDDGGTPTRSSTATATAVSPTPECPTPATPGPCPSATEEPFSGGRTAVEEEGPAVPPVAILYDVRYDKHQTFDRIVFDFRDNMPGYRVEYVDPPISQDGSGEPIDIDGNAFLHVRFNVAQAHDEAGNSTYTGPREIKPGLDSVVEFDLAGDFEGYVTWGIGLPEELDFRVIELQDPYRIAIDIEHP